MPSSPAPQLVRTHRFRRVRLGASVALLAALVSLAAAVASGRAQSAPDPARSATVARLARLTAHIERAARGVLVRELRERHSAIHDFFDGDPERAPDILRAHALTGATRAALVARHPRAAALLEEEQEGVGGTLRVLQALYDDGRCLTTYELETDAGRVRLYLPPDALPADALTGALVTLPRALRFRGRAGETVFSLAAADGPLAVVRAAARAARADERPTLVLPLNFQDNRAEPVTPDGLEDAVFRHARSVSAYWSETSQQAMDVQGDVLGYQTVPFKSDGRCEHDAWADAADQRARAAGFDPRDYDGVVYVFPRLATPSGENGCGWAGLGTLGGQPGRAWINYDPGWPQDFLRRAAAHETGHNLGLAHAGSGGDEYADPFDVMGNRGYFQVNGPHRVALGWLAGATVADVTADGTFTLAPLEHAGGGLKVLRVVRPAGSVPPWLFVSYRVPAGEFDPSFALPELGSNAGASLHTWDGVGSHITWAVPAEPARSFTLTDGRQYVDASRLLSVRQRAHDAGGAVVDVHFGPPLPLATGTPFDEAPPPTPSPTASPVCAHARPRTGVNPDDQMGAPTLGRRFAVSITNTDPPACDASDFEVTAKLPKGWRVEPPLRRVTLAPGASVLVPLVVSPKPLARSRAYGLTFRVRRTSERRAETVRGEYQVVKDDFVAPSGAILTPRAGGVVGSAVTVEAHAQDDRGVYLVELLVDGRRRGRLTRPPYLFEYASKQGGHDTLALRITDVSGNVTVSDSVTVTTSAQ